jgi:hypothetical protein
VANKVFPIGYSHYRSAERVQELMQDDKMLLIDCRITPWSERPEWREESLRKQYGERYRSAGAFLGNAMHEINKKMRQAEGIWPAPQRAMIRIAQPALGIKGLTMYLDEGKDLILLCGCSQYENCHLHVIVELLWQKRPEVQVFRGNRQLVPEGSISALSIWEPYASWLANPQWFKDGIPPKRYENRDWFTSYRGPILLHASKTFDKKALKYWSEEFEGLEGLVPTREEYHSGAIVGIADLVDIVQESDDPWFQGTYGWKLANARPIKPIPYRGDRGLFDVPLSVLHGLPQEPKVPLLLDTGPLDREDAHA